MEPRLRTALVARYGPERGRDATAEALAYAWIHRTRVLAMENPGGYLYRVGQSRTRTRREGLLPLAAHHDHEPTDPALLDALGALSERQRVSVVLIHGEGWTFAEVAQLLGVTRSSVQRHVERGLARLRTALGVAPAHEGR